MSAVAKKARPRKTVSTKTAAAKKTRARPAAKKAAVEKAPKLKQKLVRDGFTMPADDFALIETLKERLVGARRPTKKSELLRAGLHALSALSTARLVSTVNALRPLKTGRPKKND